MQLFLHNYDFLFHPSTILNSMLKCSINREKLRPTDLWLRITQENLQVQKLNINIRETGSIIDTGHTALHAWSTKAKGCGSNNSKSQTHPYPWKHMTIAFTPSTSQPIWKPLQKHQSFMPQCPINRYNKRGKRGMT